MSTYEIVGNSQSSNPIYTVPRAKSTVSAASDGTPVLVGAADSSGLQSNGFNPLVALPRNLIPTDEEVISQSVVRQQIQMQTDSNNTQTLDIDRLLEPPQQHTAQQADNIAAQVLAILNKAQAYKSEAAPTPVPAPKTENKKSTVYLHIPGACIPYQFDEVQIDKKLGLIVLVSDDQTQNSSELRPKFRPTQGSERITLSLGESAEVVSCEYFGVSFKIQSRYQITVFIIADTTSDTEELES